MSTRPNVESASDPRHIGAMAELQLQSTLTCPHCGHQATETMPTDACVAFYDCKGCGATLRPLPGSCCVFCSYGSVPCPPIQEGVQPDCTPKPDPRSKDWVGVLGTALAKGPRCPDTRQTFRPSAGRCGLRVVDSGDDSTGPRGLTSTRSNG